MKGIKKN